MEYKSTDLSVSSYIDVSNYTHARRLYIRFIVPVVIAIITIVLVLNAVLYQLEQNNIDESVIRTHTLVQNLYTNSIRHEAREIKAILNTLNKDEKLLVALAQQNRTELLRCAKPYFENFRSDFNLTHFSFIGIDRTAILRVHAPLKYGDTIERATTLQSERSGSIAHGVELGLLGNFTLRVIAPWYDKKTNKLIGYVELGMEIEHMLKELQELLDIQSFILIKKEFLDPGMWENEMHLMGRPSDWDRFPNEVVSAQSIYTIPPLLDEHLMDGDATENEGIIELSDENLTYCVASLPLEDATGRNVARIMLIINIAKQKMTAHDTFSKGIVISLAVSAMLLIFFLWLIRAICQLTGRNEKELLKLAVHDGLTGLHNHRSFHILLDTEIDRARRYQHPVSLLMIDIDYFKRVNDTYGHQAGDVILRNLSERVRTRMRRMDQVYRYGGEELAVILPETDPLTAKIIAYDLRSLVEQEPFDIGNNQFINITISIGVASYSESEHSEDYSMLISHADKALYEAKNKGRNRVCTHQAQEAA